MSRTEGCQRFGSWRAAPKRRGALHSVRALARALQRWWTKERYRPERRYMRG
jgi:hypothetical protein